MLIGERYEVKGELGQGGFGTTYRAVDRETEREVAVKVLDLGRVDDWKAVELFEREAQVLRTLDHPGIPAYIEFRPLEIERQAYLVQALAPGKNLEALLAERRFSEDDLVDLTRRVLDILDYLTTLHPVVIHRDIKPANILLADDGTVSLVDFGAVRSIAENAIGGGSTVAGTFGYMAPEQLQGEATPSSDLYGLGMTLVHLATGRVPSDFDKKRLKPDFRAHVHFSADFEQLIDRMIEPVPDDRFQSAAEARAALDELDRADPALSADSIAQRRAEADRKRAARRSAVKPAPVRPAKRSPDRVAFSEDDEGKTATIRPAPYWRGREIHFALLATLGPIVAGAVGGAIAGATGIAVGMAAVVLLGVYIWLTAPTWHLRVTRRGDFVLYKRNPARPTWIGSVHQLEVTSTRTSQGDTIAYLKFKRGPDDVLVKHVYPLTAGDAGRIKRVR